MSVTRLTHKDHKVVPVLVAGDATEFLNELCSKSEMIRKADILPQDFECAELEYIPLDPGGMMSTKDPWIQVELNGFPFTIQAGKAEGVLHNIQETILGGTVGDWNVYLNWYSLVAMKADTHNQVVEWVRTIAESPEALHADLDLNIAKDQLVKSKYLHRGDNERKS